MGPIIIESYRWHTHLNYRQKRTRWVTITRPALFYVPLAFVNCLYDLGCILPISLHVVSQSSSRGLLLDRWCPSPLIWPQKKRKKAIRIRYVRGVFKDTWTFMGKVQSDVGDVPFSKHSKQCSTEMVLIDDLRVTFGASCLYVCVYLYVCVCI